MLLLLVHATPVSPPAAMQMVPRRRGGSHSGQRTSRPPRSNSAEASRTNRPGTPEQRIQGAGAGHEGVKFRQGAAAMRQKEDQEAHL